MPHRPLLHFSLAVLFAAASCSNQGEGERCDVNSKDSDCKSGLICVSQQQLLDKTQGDRCCPETVTASTDSRCRRGVAPANTGGSAGMAAGGEGGEPAAGSPGSGGAQAEAGAGGEAEAGAGGEAEAGAGGEAEAGASGTDTGGAGGTGP